MSGTDFRVVVDERVYEEWPESHSHREIVVEGVTADKVRARSQLDGEVRLIEDGQEGGYSEYTVEWEYDFEVRVGRVVVWRTDHHSEFDASDSWASSSFARFMSWLDGTR